MLSAAAGNEGMHKSHRMVTKQAAPHTGNPDAIRGIDSGH